MAVSVAAVTAGKFNIGNKKIRIFDVTFTGSYVLGGETITPATVGLKRIITVSGTLTDTAGLGYVPRWVESTGKLVIHESGTASAGLDEQDAAAYPAGTAGRLTFMGE